jgi:hypothetical protein
VRTNIVADRANLVSAELSSILVQELSRKKQHGSFDVNLKSSGNLQLSLPGDLTLTDAEQLDLSYCSLTGALLTHALALRTLVIQLV